MDVRLPDGRIIQNVPDGTTKADLVAKLQGNGMAVPSEWLAAEPAKPMAQTVGEQINGIPRQLGLTARYALEGPAQAAEVVTEPIRQYITDPLMRAFTTPKLSDLVTGQQPAQGKPLGKIASQFADWLGLPSPQGANERVIGDASRMVAGAAGFAGAAGQAARGASGITRKVLQSLAANPTVQAVSAAGAGTAGGAAREGGASPLVQAGASLVGGLAAPTAVNAATTAARGVRNTVRAMLPANLQNVDQQIELTLRPQGIDWSTVPERVKQGMRDDVANALNAGQDLNPDAMRRLLDFRSVPGTTPTRGMLTLDPVQITRERNLAKTGANTADLGLQGLAQVENRNNSALIDALNNAGARNAPDAFQAGQQVIGSLQRQVDAAQSNIGNLYSQARDTAGRSASLDPGAFTRRANELLDQGLLGGALPSSVQTHLNRIATGEVPFTVDYAEQLKTAMGKLQRASNDGQTRMALGTVRQALEETPLLPSRQVNPGNLPAVPGTVPPSPSTLGQESIDAFNRARQANRQFMQHVESTPALSAVVEGAQPDQFVKHFIIGAGASVEDVRALRTAMRDDPQALQAVRSHIVDHLKQRALNGAADEVGNFSQSAYNKAIEQIGERKLSEFFDSQEIAQLKSVGRVASYMQVQPRGSAVNNSNSGALMLGKGLDVLDRLSGKLPLGLPATIQGLLRGVQQQQALRVSPSLLLPQSGAPMGQRLIPPLLGGGLLLPGIPQRQDQ